MITRYGMPHEKSSLPLGRNAIRLREWQATAQFRNKKRDFLKKNPTKKVTLLRRHLVAELIHGAITMVFYS